MMKDSETAQIIEEEEDPTAFSLIDVSANSDDDFLLASSSDVSAAGNPGDFLAEGARTNQPSHSVELQQPRKNGKCNLRKSLAWDSAFFTNAGVLDAEELSSIIEGAETSVKQKSFLPGIEEDLSKSYDSVSTFESDNLTLESLEADLFCDVRASIQRTSRPSAQGNRIGTKLLGEGESTNGCSTKAVEISPSNAVKPKMATKKLNPSVQPPSRTLKPGTISKQIAKPPVRSKESKSLLPRPPETAAKPSSIGAAATKKTSIGASRAKLESNTSGISKGKVTSFSKASYQAESSKTVPKTLASSKFSSGSSVLGRGAAIRSSRSSCDSSSSTSSGTTRKSPSDINKRKTDKIVNLAPGSKIRAPSRVAVKSKPRSGDSHLSDYLKSTSKLSPSISPTSSISEWSTESSSSTATINQKLIGSKSCSTSFQDTVLESNVPHSQNHFSDSVSLCRTASESDVSLCRPASAKPSGLRMPSATIGFFDGVKAAAKTPSGGSRSRSALPSSLPRSGALNNTPSGTSGKQKAVVKPDSRRTVSNLKPVCLYDHSAGLPKTLNAENVDRVSDFTSKVSEIDLLDPAFEENDEILKGGKHDVDSSSEAIEDNRLVAAKKDESPEAKSHSITNQATIAVEDVGNAMLITDCIEDLTESPSSKEGLSNRKEDSDVENVDTVSETSSKVLILDPALEENDRFVNEGKQAGDASSEDINLVKTKKEVSPDVKLQSSTNQATIAAEDVGNSIEDLLESPFSRGGRSNRKENTDIENVDTVSESSPKVSGSVLLGPAFEVLNGGEHAVGCSSEATNDINLIAAKKEASPEVKLHSSTNHVAIAVQDVSNTMHVTDCIEDPTESRFSLEGASNKKEQSDVENVDTVSESSSKVSESVLFDLAFEENGELLNEERNAADSCSEATKDIYIVAAKKEASPEVKSHSSANQATVAIEDVCNAMHLNDCITDLTASLSSKDGGHDRKQRSDVDSVYPSRDVSETDSLKIGSVLACKNEGGIVGHGPTGEHQDSGYGAIDVKQYGHAEEQVDSFGTHIEATNDEMEVQRESNGIKQSHNLMVNEDINLVATKKEASPEVKLHSSTNHARIAVEGECIAIHMTGCIGDLTDTPFSKEGQSHRKEHSDLDDVSPSQEVGENDSLEFSSVNACLDVSDSPTADNQDSGHGAIEAEQNSHAEKQVESFGTHVETKNNEVEMASESNDKFQSQNLLVDEDNSSFIPSRPKELCTEESVQPESIIPGSLSLLSSETSPGTRTPFAIKNSVADLIKAYNKSAEPAVQVLVKSDTLPSLEEGQKENC